MPDIVGSLSYFISALLGAYLGMFPKYLRMFVSGVLFKLNSWRVFYAGSFKVLIINDFNVVQYPKI